MLELVCTADYRTLSVRVKYSDKVSKFTINGSPVSTGIILDSVSIKIKLVYLGSPVNGVKAIEAGCSGIVAIAPFANFDQVIPYDDGATWVDIQYVSEGIISLRANSNISHWNCYAIIFYIW